MTRWTATITYRTEHGPVDVPHDIDEIEELHDLVEAGPHWDAIHDIRIIRQGAPRPLTLEEAQKL